MYTILFYERISGVSLWCKDLFFCNKLDLMYVFSRVDRVQYK